MHAHLTRAVSAACFLLLAAGSAHANEFLTQSRSDWFRYTSGSREVRSQITMESGGWRMWDQFAGLGANWVWSDPQTDEWVFVWNGRDAQPLGNLAGAAGQAYRIDLGGSNVGVVRVAEVGGRLTTAAGAFTNVTRVDLPAGSIWFSRGVGVVQWSERSSAGATTTWSLASALVGGRSYPAAAPAPAPTPTPTPAAAGLRAPVEHAPMESVLWASNDPYIVVDTYAGAWPGLASAGVLNEVIVDTNYVASQLRYEMAQRGVSLDRVEFMVVPLDSVWMRDFGPIVLKDAATGERVVADLDYFYNRPRDDAFPQAYATYRGWRRVRVPLSFEGGNFATDGRGRVMTTTGVLRFNRNKSRAQVEAELRKLGGDQVTFVEPLVEEGTTHIDMLAKVMTDGAAFVSSYPSSHRQARVTNAAAATFEGLGYRVVRLEAARNWDEFASYTNSTIANGVALVPQYGDATRDRAARDAYQALGYRPVAVDSRLSIQYGGAIHCLSMQIPR